jgi:hypothetical protein
VGGEGGEVARWVSQKGRGDAEVGKSGEVEDGQRVEERMGFGVCLAAGEADGVGGRGRPRRARYDGGMI